MRLAELAAIFTIAADAGMGMPMDHGLRSAAVAVRLGELAKATVDDLASAYYAALLRYVGCTSEANLAAHVMGDEVAMRGELYGVDFGAPREVLPRIFRAKTRELGRARGIASSVRTLGLMPKLFSTGLAHCEVADRLAARLGFDETFRAALFQTFERWDGRGWPRNVKGEGIALAMRLAQAGEDIEIGHRQGGVDGALEIVTARAKKSLDPRLVAVVTKNAAEICAPLEEPSPWKAALAAEPAPHRMADEGQVDEVLLAIADFADLRSKYRRAHSRTVSSLARDAARRMGLDEATQRNVARAALLHDLGVAGISAGIWDKARPLTDAERERIRMHTYIGERVLANASSLADVAEIAMLAHERIDGSGYHRKLAGPSCSKAARILAVADVYCALREDRPHRAALDGDAAEAELRRAVGLCPEAIDAVLASAGHAIATRSAAPRVINPGRLTDREVEVLRLLARGLTNKEIASALDISARTAGHHIEHIFEKVGVTTRAAATMFAMETGLMGNSPHGRK